MHVRRLVGPPLKLHKWALRIADKRGGVGVVVLRCCPPFCVAHFDPPHMQFPHVKSSPVAQATYPGFTSFLATPTATSRPPLASTIRPCDMGRGGRQPSKAGEPHSEAG